MLIADIMIHHKAEGDIGFDGYVHPQINPGTLISTAVGNYSLPEGSHHVLVTSENVRGPYKFDVKALED